jgi:hypothetical protein
VIFPQPLLILFCLFFPIYCLLKNKHKWLIIWVSLTIIIDIFNSQKYMNLTAFKMCGIAVTPYLFKNLRTLLKVSTIKIIIAYSLYLGILGILFGHIFPWVDPTGQKGGRDISQWRSIIHLGSYTLEMSATIYLALQFQQLRNILYSVKTIITGALISSFAAFIENFTQFDFYNFFTSQAKVFIPYRMKGLNYEPRGFAQSQAYGVILSLFFIKKSLLKYFLLISIFLFSMFYLSMSATGNIILAVGIIIPLLKLFYDYLRAKKYKTILLILIGHILILSFIAFIIPNSKVSSMKKHYGNRRTQSTYFLESAQGLFQSL